MIGSDLITSQSKSASFLDDFKFWKKEFLSSVVQCLKLDDEKRIEFVSQSLLEIDVRSIPIRISK